MNAELNAKLAVLRKEIEELSFQQNKFAPDTESWGYYDEQIKDKIKRIEQIEKEAGTYYKWEPIQEESKPKSTIKYKLENYDKNLNPNQWVIENNKKDFEAFKRLEKALHRLKERKCAFYAMYHFLGDNQDGFNFVLYNTKFQKDYGYGRDTYMDVINAMLFYGILVPTYRKKVDPTGVACRVFVFNANLDPDSLPDTAYNPKNKDHLAQLRELKKMYDMNIA